MPVKEPVTKAKQAAATTAPARPSTYKVRNGDTLDKIAKRYGTTAAAIRKANGMAANDSRIWAGKTIKLPAAGTGTTAKKKKSTKRK